MSAISTVQQVSIRLSRLPVPKPWAGFLLHLSGFPTPEAELAPVRVFLDSVVALLLKQNAGSLATFLQFSQLHVADGSLRFSSRTREWMPSLGLGVWPDREPPHPWTLDELRDLAPDEKPRSLMDVVLRVGAPRKDMLPPPEQLKALPDKVRALLQDKLKAPTQAKGDDIRNVMLGLGTVLQFVVALDQESFLATARKLLLPPISDPMFTSFQFYVPLLQSTSISNANPALLEAWSCGAYAYIRESPEDQGILLWTRTQMEDVFRQAGAVSHGDEWSIPY